MPADALEGSIDGDGIWLPLLTTQPQPGLPGAGWPFIGALEGILEGCVASDGMLDDS